MHRISRGFLVTLEGTDGSGKTTLLGMVEKFFEMRGYPTVRTIDPGGTAAGERIRSIILEHLLVGEQIEEWTEAFLYLASRRQLVAEVIRPALRAGRVVISDRFTDSTIAYQGFGRRLPLEGLVPACAIAADGIAPDLRLWLDIDPEKGLARSGPADRMEAAGLDFQKRVRRGYRFLARNEPERFRKIEVGRTPGETFKKASREIDAFLAGRERPPGGGTGAPEQESSGGRKRL